MVVVSSGSSGSSSNNSKALNAGREIGWEWEGWRQMWSEKMEKQQIEQRDGRGWMQRLWAR